MAEDWFRLTSENAHALLTAWDATILAELAADLNEDDRLPPEQHDQALMLARAVAERELRNILATVADGGTVQ